MNAERAWARGRLVVVCGLPGAGKTTLARRLERDYAATRLCPDEWMIELGIDLFDEDARSWVERVQWRLAQRLLHDGETVIIEWGTWGRSERDALRQRARELGAAVELRFLDEPLEILWARVQARDTDRRRSERALTLLDMANFAATFQRPDPDELALFDPPLS